MAKSLVKILATREEVAPPINDPIMCHLDTLNIKICPIFQIILIEQDVARSLVPIFATKEALSPLANDPVMLG